MDKAARSYHVVFVRYAGMWAIHFGDYVRSVAKQEAVDVRSADSFLHLSDVRTMSLPDDTQATMNKVHAGLNAGEYD